MISPHGLSDKDSRTVVNFEKDKKTIRQFCSTAPPCCFLASVCLWSASSSFDAPEDVFHIYLR
ncbi:hypothetical protein M413DRAFT_445799 [Hebeloma cylindrosporum]|uniref:Uncharacterized protein n=1 Tax=Hebeloma cylindrosporum TaxID=76867 RepID=A0A0C3CBR8_HEBCY|nr:hypothetical protein M413DRAFT_445799 [Hebeloma cylindrosporum h7]